MPDREKVIKGLHRHCECSLFDRCGECPYYETDYDSWGESNFICRDALLQDVLALLKEQERIIKLYEKAEPFLYSHGWDWTQVEGWIKQE